VPRTGEGARVLVKDLHGSVAVLFSVVILAFLVTALPWTQFWGNQVAHADPERDRSAVAVRCYRACEERGAAGVPAMTLDEAVQRARAAGVMGGLEIKLDTKADSALSMRNRLARASQESAVAFDRYSRQTAGAHDLGGFPADPARGRHRRRSARRQFLWTRQPVVQLDRARSRWSG
jgi:uncharacterized iron-regulated membrane protein